MRVPRIGEDVCRRPWCSNVPGRRHHSSDTGVRHGVRRGPMCPCSEADREQHPHSQEVRQSDALHRQGGPLVALKAYAAITSGRPATPVLLRRSGAEVPPGARQVHGLQSASGSTDWYRRSAAASGKSGTTPKRRVGAAGLVHWRRLAIAVLGRVGEYSRWIRVGLPQVRWLR